MTDIIIINPANKQDEALVLKVLTGHYEFGFHHGQFTIEVEESNKEQHYNWLEENLKHTKADIS